MPRPILAIDLDGTLCESREDKTSPMSPADCLNAKPIKEMIDRVNKLSWDYFVVIYTARRNHLVSATLDWLHQHNVFFDALSNRKMPADYYVDDKNIKL